MDALAFHGFPVTSAGFIPKVVLVLSRLLVLGDAEKRHPFQEAELLSAICITIELSLILADLFLDRTEKHKPNGGLVVVLYTYWLGIDSSYFLHLL